MRVARPQTDSEFHTILLNAGATPVLVDFFATWCGPCNMIAPTFEDLSGKYPNLKFVKVDVDKCTETKTKYGIEAMPTFMILLNGQKMDIIRGADKAALSNLAQKWSVNCPSPKDSPVPGQFDLSPFIDRQQSECRNEDDQHNLRNFLDSQGSLISDCDEQLLIYLQLHQAVKIHSIRIRGPKGKAPKTVKIFANLQTPLDFDEASSAEPIQTIDFTTEDQNVAALKYVKFQNILNLQIFIVDNDEGGDKTIVEELSLFGTPVSGTTNMQDFKRVAGKAGEADHWMNDVDIKYNIWTIRFNLT